jgi:hypothetical protein
MKAITVEPEQPGSARPEDGKRRPRRVTEMNTKTTEHMNIKTYPKCVALVAALVAANVAVPLLPGCASKATVQTQSASVGQQLQDLEKAYKAGTISEKEYEKLKKAIIKKND